MGPALGNGSRPKSRMKILLTNDDGIHAPGLWALAAELSRVGEVFLFAPHREQSGIGTAITLRQPVRFAEVEPAVSGVKAYAVEGTPADSVILGLQIVKDADAVFSGINAGANMANDVLLSGTVGGALQGHMHGLPSVALSVEVGAEMHFEAAARLGRLLAGKLAGVNSRDVLLNVNLPNLPLQMIRGVALTRLGRGGYSGAIRMGHDGQKSNYRIDIGEPYWVAEEGTDVGALRESKASITPLKGTLSAAEGATPLDGHLSALFQELIA